MLLTKSFLSVALLAAAVLGNPTSSTETVSAGTNSTIAVALKPVAFEDAGLKPNIAPKATGGFSYTCWNTQLVGSGSGLSLAAMCGNGNGGTNGWTYLPINNCIANDNGILKCARNGNALLTCDGCHLQADYHNRMDCSCYHNNGSKDWTTAYLDDCITNYYGNLIC